MTSAFDEAAVRGWLVDYLVTNNGCSPEHIDRGASMHDLGVGSRDAVVLTGVLSEYLGRTVSPVDFWQYPTVDALAKYLTGGEVEPVDLPADRAGRSSLDEPIAVIGLGCRFPGGPDFSGNIEGPEAFWEFLTEGGSSVGEVPAERWAWSDDGTPEGAAALAGITRWGSFLRDIDAFDAEFFEIMPREATRMDPQQRLLLEVIHEALEHAGIPADSLAETQTGVFAGASAGDYAHLSGTDLNQIDAWYATGGAISIIANRVSYFFDLRGPSVTIDTACSSSLVAIHLACQSLRSGDSELALAGGVNLLLSPAATRSLDEAEAMSKTGQCHAFDAAADGFVRGEGCRGGGAQAAVGRPARRRPGAGGDPRFGGQPGRPLQRSDGAQPGRPDGGAARGLRRRRHRTPRGRLRRSPRHRHAVGRPDRGPRTGHRAGPRPRRRRPAADRRGQVQPRPPGSRRRYRRVRQGSTGVAAQHDSGQPRLPEPQPAHPVRQAAVESDRRAHRLGPGGTAATRRDLVVRVRRHQRPRGDRTGPRHGARTAPKPTRR